MFLCEKCLEENFTNFALPVSRGKCEYCEETKPCTDIPSSRLIAKEKPVAKE